MWPTDYFEGDPMNSCRAKLTRGVVAVAAAVLFSCSGAIAYARQAPVLPPQNQYHQGKPPRPQGGMAPGVSHVKPGKPVPKSRPPHVKYRPPQEVHWKHYSNRYEYREHSYKYKHRPPKHYGRVYRSLPHNAFSFYLGGTTFFYYSGLYYRHGRDGYVVVTAPVGARVHVLPDTCSYFYYNGDRCYACDDVFYREVGREYVVIERPPRFNVIVEQGDLVRITTDALNVRSGPGTQYRVTARLSRGDVVEVGAIESGWYYVRFGNDSYGWIMQRYTNPYDVYDGPRG